MCYDKCDSNNLYSCQEKNCAEENQCESAANFLQCVDCILAYIKRGHKIHDSKGIQPKICASHKLISSVFRCTWQQGGSFMCNRT